MARGFLSGLIWGGVVSVVGVGAVSILADGPMAPDAVVEAPQSSAAPTAGDESTAGAVTDADLVRDSEASQVQSPSTDDVDAATAAGSDTPTVPETGGAEGLEGPAQAATNGGVNVVDESPVLPGAQANLPSAPNAEGAVSISTDPAQPPAPNLPETDGAFEGDTAETSITDDPVQPQAPEVGESSDLSVVEDATDPVDPEAPTAPEAPESDAPAPPQGDIAALAPAPQEPGAIREGGPTIGRQGTSLIDRATETAPEAEPKTEAAGDLPPIKAFAVPFENPDEKPLMAIVLIDNGVDLTGGPVGIAALQSFPYPLSFAVDASLPDVARRMAEYRAKGFEVMAQVNLPEGATASDAEVALSAILSAAPEAVAVIEGVGTGVQGSRDASDQITEALKASGHGLVLQSKGLNTAQKLAVRAGVPTGLIFRDFDSAGQSPSVIRRFLDQAAFRAGQEGGMIMVGRVRPDTISALLLWGLQDRAERVALAPVSAVLGALAEEQ